MELTLDQKHDLLARLSARTYRPYDPERDITIEDMMTELARAGGEPSRNVAARILKRAVNADEMTEGWAMRDGRKIRVYRQKGAA